MNRTLQGIIRARALLCMVGLAPALVLADSKESATHVMQWVEDENIHLADQAGAINRRGDVKISVEVFSGKQVIVSDAGTRYENNLYHNYSTQDSTKWSNVWRGTWSLSGDKMVLDLTLQDRKCTHQKTTRDAAPETLPCAAVSKQIQLTCRLEQVTTEDRTAASPARATVRVWTCAPEAPAEMGETPSRWVLGKASCVKVLGGRHGHGYQKCTAP